jgi:hypothetical protein
MALIERCFEEVYKKPWKYGHVVKLLRSPDGVDMEPEVD